MSDTSHRRSVTPAAIAGVTRLVIDPFEKSRPEVLMHLNRGADDGCRHPFDFL